VILSNIFARVIPLSACLSLPVNLVAPFESAEAGSRQPSTQQSAATHSSSNGMYASNARINARFSGSDFAPDGNLSKKVWKNAKWTEFTRDMSGRSAYPEARTRVAVVWTPTQVYFAFWCKYTALNIYDGESALTERWELWNRDVVEVFLNPQPDRLSHYFEFEVAPNNQWIDLEIEKKKTPFNDAAWNSGFAHATRIDSRNRVWTCEMRIPIASMGSGRLLPDTEWRLNVFRADGPGDDDHRRFLSWSTIPEGTTFHVPERFGILHFLK
jgi:hypothetical protein